MNILKTYCDQNNINATQLAALVKLPVPTVWRHINSKYNPSGKNAILYSRALNLPTDELLNCKENDE